MTIFSRIIAGEIPCYKVAENEHFVAFLDINPMVKGHTLVVPKLPQPEEAYIFRLDDSVLAEMMVFAKQAANAMQSALGCKRVGMAVLGMEVPHVHIHLVPLNQESDMDFKAQKVSMTAEEMEQVAASIRDAY